MSPVPFTDLPMITINQLNSVCWDELIHHIDVYLHKYVMNTQEDDSFIETDESKIFDMFMRHTFGQGRPNIFIEVYFPQPFSISVIAKEYMYYIIQTGLNIPRLSITNTCDILTKYVQAWAICEKHHFVHYIETYIMNYTSALLHTHIAT